ncbi:U3 small nucleolar RNA-associated protein 6-domain-containing protein [Butyriboletus roseoflavus]|nr:U3 small nucleolar RNA-associated protein 6-domain-containing protein [Butyriboletus roseoflavus]
MAMRRSRLVPSCSYLSNPVFLQTCTSDAGLAVSSPRLNRAGWHHGESALSTRAGKSRAGFFVKCISFNKQMLAELKDLVQKSLFTQAEVKQILKKRTQFETALVRRVAKKSDFLRYAAYEMGLEQLRRKRLQRLNLPKSKSTISDYALVRRQFQIFERALKRFKSDIGLWIQYIQVAKREGARALVGRITAR